MRQVSDPITEDRFMQPEVDAVLQLIRENKIWEVVSPFLETLEAMEELDPDALRTDAKTPTGIVMADRLDNEDEEDSC